MEPDGLSLLPAPAPTPSGLGGIHRLANRGLLVSLLLSSVLCVLELQVRLNMSRTYGALQDARTMQQLLLDSRSQLVAALGTVDASGSTDQGDPLTGQDSEPLPASTTPEPTVEALVHCLKTRAAGSRLAPRCGGY